MADATTRERFLALDGLRGIAAFSVLLFHLNGSLHLHMAFAHGYLAVDFFFLLSGFVIAHAYEERLRAPGGIGSFVRERVIRLHPLLLLSLVPNGAVLVLSMIHGKPLFSHPLLALVLAAVPIPALWLRPDMFPLNRLSWSLFWELAVNFAFALAAPRLGNRVLGAIIAAAVTAAVAVSLTKGGVNVGGLTAGARAISAFAIGVALLRVHRTGRFRVDWLGAAAAPLLLLSLAAVPAKPWIAAVYDPLAMFGLFPLIVLAGARREARFPRICAWLGGVSYPLYILQGPLQHHLRAPIEHLLDGSIAAGLSLIAIVLAVSLVAWKLYDEPLRAALRRRFIRPTALAPGDTPAF